MHDALGTEFVGRRALVTGGGTGIGAAAARALAKAGASVVLIGRRPEPLERLAAELSAEGATDASAFPADVVDRRQVAAAFRFATNAIGAPEIVVAAAGVAFAATLENTSDADLDRTFAVNVAGVRNVLREATPSMTAAGFGRVVVVASTAALRGYRYNAAYVASKHAVLGLVRSVAAEVVSKGVTVNAVCPGFVDTDIVDTAAATLSEKSGRSFDDAKGLLAAQNPLGRLVRPEEVAHAILSLAAASASAINGAALVVDGGTPGFA
jgi:NAD(P)-dependent dehydrogenase (short-subunit alcohol dehydrogenase family)